MHFDSPMKSRLQVLSLYLMELTLLDGGHFLSYRPSVISAAAVCTARHIMQHRPWPAELAALHAGVDLVQLQVHSNDFDIILTISHTVRSCRYDRNFDSEALSLQMGV